LSSGIPFFAPAPSADRAARATRRAPQDGARGVRAVEARRAGWPRAPSLPLPPRGIATSPSSRRRCSQRAPPSGAGKGAPSSHYVPGGLGGYASSRGARNVTSAARWRAGFGRCLPLPRSRLTYLRVFLYYSFSHAPQIRGFGLKLERVSRYGPEGLPRTAPSDHREWLLAPLLLLPQRRRRPKAPLINTTSSSCRAGPRARAPLRPLLWRPRARHHIGNDDSRERRKMARAGAYLPACVCVDFYTTLFLPLRSSGVLA